MGAKKTLKLTLEEYGYELDRLIYPVDGLVMAIAEAMKRHAEFHHEKMVKKNINQTNCSTVASETGKTHRQLADENKLLFEAVQSAYECSGQYNHLTKAVLDKMLFAINKTLDL